MVVQDTNNQLLEVVIRIRELREIMGYSTQDMARLTGIDEAQYIDYECGATDLPFTFLHKCARALGVELIQLLEGQSARLTNYAVTRRGRGLVTASEDGIVIQDTAARSMTWSSRAPCGSGSVTTRRSFARATASSTTALSPTA